MKKIDANPPSGTRDFLPEEVKLREAVFSTVKKVFESFGFLPLETPAFERLEVLSGKYGEEGEKLIYKILKRGEGETRGETDLALRYDFTIPLARVVAKYRDKLPTIFKRYQIGPVWRAERPQAGRFREFAQCDADIVGTKSRLADAEIILVLAAVLKKLGLPRFSVRLNSRKVLSGLMEIYKVPRKLEKSVFIALDKLDKVGVVGVKKELLKRGLKEKLISQITEDAKNFNPESLRRKLKKSKAGQEGLNDIDEISGFVSPNLGGASLVFSPFLARGLDYYTGPIFEIAAVGSNSSIAGGGRYDNLIGMFSRTSTPACGGSLGIERIISILEKSKKLKSEEIWAKVLVTVWDKSFQAESLKLAMELREKGIATEVYLGEGAISRQLSFASKNNIPYCVIFGPKEKANGEVAVKSLETGGQKNFSKDNLPSFLRGK